MPSPSSIQLSCLTYYPIEAWRGFDVASSLVTRMGLGSDRRLNLGMSVEVL